MLCRANSPRNCITLEGDTTERAMPLAVFMERIRHFIKSPLTLIPLAECECDAVVCQSLPSQLLRVRVIDLNLGSRFDLGSTAEFFEEPVDTPLWMRSNSCLDRLRLGNSLPMWMCA